MVYIFLYYGFMMAMMMVGESLRLTFPSYAGTVASHSLSGFFLSICSSYIFSLVGGYVFFFLLRFFSPLAFSIHVM